MQVKPTRHRSAALFTIAALVMGIALPAMSVARAADPEHIVAEPQQWPPPPAPARVRFVQQVALASDWGVARGWWGRVVDSLTGRRERGFVRPTGVCESGGVLYVADPGAQAVWIFDGPGKKQLRVGRVGEDMLASPVAVSPAGEGDVYVADSVLARVLRLGRDGRLLHSLAHPDMQRPSSLAFDALRRRLYVGDSKAHVVHVFDDHGTHLATIGGLGDDLGKFNSPTHLAAAPDGSLVVTDALNFRIQVFDADGRPLQSFGRIGDGSGNFAAPKGVAVDRWGHVYVADAMFDAVQVFDTTGQLMLGFGSQGAQPGQFWLPNGLYINGQDRLFVADAYNRRIQVFELLGAPAPDPEARR
jgi:DNA-binding beta-propeller fold protein YncE